jgi:hypothetical protein
MDEAFLKTHRLKHHISLNISQIRSHKSLILNFLIPAVNDYVQKNKQGDNPAGMLSNGYGEWAKGEIIKNGYTSAYHLWEKQFKDIIKELPKKQQLNTKRKNLIDDTRKYFQMYYDINIDDKIWSALNEARLVINTFKHGDDNDFWNLFRRHHGYLSRRMPGGSPSAAFIITRQKFEDLISSIEVFWECIKEKEKIYQF